MNAIPRTDVGAAGISGVLASVIMMILQHDGVYSFNSVYALIFGLVVAGAGYLAGKNKSFVMLVAAPAATLAAAAIGKILYGVQWDNATVSVALSAFLVALVGYLAPARPPDAPPVVVASDLPPASPVPPDAELRRRR